MNNKSLVIKFYDVEHGNCTHIITPNNKHILVDIGSKSENSIVSYLKNKYLNGDNKKIDGLILTHLHEDHIYDLPKLISEGLGPKVLRHPKEAFDLPLPKENETFKEIVKVANKMNSNYILPVEDCNNPFKMENNGGVNMEFISPIANLTDKSDPNSFSNLIIVNYASTKIVLTGDNPKTILEEMILKNHQNIKEKIRNADFLLAPHHGRNGEFSKIFFELVNPKISIISDKRIIHETQENSANLYRGSGLKINGTDRYALSTRNDGDINLFINEYGYEIKCDLEDY